ncbi:TetR/AcrR family transcriptional regulator [Garicola koreensis]|uniref:TetR/AcrR family transcriptional regulator n=1 Tax=Garicola koreensis TaxID=1262554 RepID=UPI0031E6883D
MTEEGETKPRGRPRSEQAHQRILEATSRLLSHTSYDSITVERIATEAEVGKQTIYRWWPNKASVVLEAILSGYADLQLAPMPDTGDLAADLHSWMRDMIAEGFRDERIAMARSLMAAGLEGLPSTEALLQQDQLWDSGPLVSRLRAAAERGEIAGETHLPAVASALTDPLIFHIMTGKPRTEQWGAGLVDVVLRGISPDPRVTDAHPQ